MAVPALLTASVVTGAPIDWKPNPGECALCPNAFEDKFPDYWERMDPAWYTDEHGRCADEEDHAEPSRAHDHRCVHLLGKFPPLTIRGPPWGDGAVPMAGEDPNLGYGPHLTPEVYERCGVNGTEYFGNQLVDRKCLRQWLDAKQEEDAVIREPCTPCDSYDEDGTYHEEKGPCFKSCRQNHTIDRVSWLKEWHPFKTILKVETDGLGHTRARAVGQRTDYKEPIGLSSLYWDWYDPDFSPQHEGHEIMVEEPEGSKVKRQRIPPPPEQTIKHCGNLTDLDGATHPIPVGVCIDLNYRQDTKGLPYPYRFSDPTMPPFDGRMPLPVLESATETSSRQSLTMCHLAPATQSIQRL